jgi:hypothetical protein
MALGIFHLGTDSVLLLSTYAPYYTKIWDSGPTSTGPSHV